jgi:hypothetical protein
MSFPPPASRFRAGGSSSSWGRENCLERQGNKDDWLIVDKIEDVLVG